MSEQERVYVFRVGQLGDSLVAVPAVYELAKRYPQRKFTLITNKPARASFVAAWEVMRHTGLFDDVLDYDASNPRDMLGLAARLRFKPGRKVLCYLAAHRSFRQRLRDRLYYRGLCGFDRVVGLSASPIPERRHADGSLRRLPREWQHLQEHLARELGTDGEPPRAPLLHVPDDTAAKADALLAPVAGRTLVALGPGSKMPAKKWFLDRFVALGRRLLEERPGWGLAILGGPEDRTDGEHLLASLGAERVVNLAGQTSIIESAAAMARCRLYVGNDTGTMHIAASMGLRCVAMFTSRENPGTWEPFGEGHAILRHELSCSGCMLTECVEQQMRCLDLIDVRQALEATLRVIDDLESGASA